MPCFKACDWYWDYGVVCVAVVGVGWWNRVSTSVWWLWSLDSERLPSNGEDVGVTNGKDRSGEDGRCCRSTRDRPWNWMGKAPRINVKPGGGIECCCPYCLLMV